MRKSLPALIKEEHKRKVLTPDQFPFETIKYIGIAIKKTEHGHHVGILYRDNEIRLLHLAWHLRLENDPPTRDYLWISPPIHELRAKQLAANCRLVWRRNAQNGVPYAFSDPRGFIWPSGELKLGPTKFGLTCATFVLAILEMTGLRLINYDTWESRGDDENFQKWVISMLEKSKVDEAAISAARSEIGLVRYRPCEVAGAAMVAPPPLDFTDVTLLEAAVEEKAASWETSASALSLNFT